MNTDKEIFLIDSNTFITPYRTYYSPDLVPTFWDFFKTNIENGRIAVLSKVYEEVSRGGDALSKWMASLSIKTIDHRQPLVMENYRRILNHIQKSPAYNDKALAEWSDNNRADAWLIAAAMTFGRSVVTFEQPNYSLGTYVCAHPKIPDICSDFNVKCNDLFNMMRSLEFSFS
jgi:hypothetical protein